MDLALVLALAVTATLLAVACVLLAVVLAGSRSTRRALADSRAEVEALAARVAQVETTRRATPVVPDSGYLITDAGVPAGQAAGQGADHVADHVADGARTRFVLSQALAEPLVKAMAFSYGVHRALSPANRNRIRFEMRREVRRARKQRRRDAWRKPREYATRPREAAS